MSSNRLKSAESCQRSVAAQSFSSSSASVKLHPHYTLTLLFLELASLIHGVTSQSSLLTVRRVNVSPRSGGDAERREETMSQRETMNQTLFLCFLSELILSDLRERSVANGLERSTHTANALLQQSAPLVRLLGIIFEFETNMSATTASRSKANVLQLRRDESTRQQLERGCRRRAVQTQS